MTLLEIMSFAMKTLLNMILGVCLVYFFLFMSGSTLLQNMLFYK